MNHIHFARRVLRGSTALSALAVIGGGFTASTFIATPASAQDYTTGVIVGSVRTPEGAPVAGGTATVVSNEQSFTRTVTIGADGQFRVPSLPTGSYTVTIAVPGYQSVADPNIAVAAGTSNTWVFTVEAAGSPTGAAEAGGGEIVVIGKAVRANDFAATTTGLLVDVDELAQTVPIARNQTALILLAPGTTQGDTGFGNLASVGGATVAENSYYVNGLNTTDFRNFLGSSIVPFEFYKTLDVQTGGYQAEFGRALGGFVNATTERGSNEFRGGAILTYSPDWLQESSPNTYAAFNEADYAESGSATLFLGGPVIPERLFFYGFYNPRFFETGNTSILSNQRVESSGSTPFWGGKLDANIVDGHRLEFTIFSDEQTTDYNYLRTADNRLTGQKLGRTVTETGGLNYIGTYTGAFTDWLTLSASYGKNENAGIQKVSPNQALVQSQLTGTTTVASGFSSARLGDQDTREVYRVDADLYVNNLFGDHHIRAGYDREDLTAAEDTAYTGSGYRYILQPSRILRYYYANQGEFNTTMSAFYLQDSWNLFDQRLNLNLGIRNDSFQNKNAAGEVYYKSKNNWGPRLGATFDLFGDRRTKLQAFWGRYFLPIATNTNIRLAGAETYYVQGLTYPVGFSPATAGWNASGFPNGLPLNATGDPLTGGFSGGSRICPAGSPNAGEPCLSVYASGEVHGTDTVVAQGLKPSHTDEIILGITHRMGDWTAGLQYINRRLGETLEDVAVDAAVLAYCEREGIAGCDAVWTGYHQYVLANPGKDITVALSGDCDVDPRQCEVATLAAEDLRYPRASRKYDSIQLTLNRRWDETWSFGGSYTWTKLRGNFEGAVKSDNNQTDAGLTQDFDQPGFLEGAFGTLANERRHQLKAYGAYQLLPWLRAGANLSVASPRKFSCIGEYRNDPGSFEYYYGAASYWCQQPQFADNNAGEANGSYLVPRGTAFKSEWLKQVDLGLAFTLPGLNNSEFRIDVFNVFNWKSELDFNEFGDVSFGGPNSRYGQVLGYQSPRSVRFTLGMRFGPGFGGSREEESHTQGR